MEQPFIAYIKQIFILLRPHQWVKNLFVFAPLFFSFNYSTEKISSAAAGFIFFCMAASSIYIFNDYHDIEDDRQHPEKKERPLASGKVNRITAISFMIILLSLSLTGAVLLSLEYASIVASYLVMNILYTLKLKHISILDISIIATGFVLRIFAGAVIIDVNPSMWIVLVTFLLALFLALAKRRDDCLLAGEGMKTRKSIDGYTLEMINLTMIFMATLTVVSYIMYTISNEVITRFGSGKLYLTTAPVIIGILRYMQITFVEEKSGSPTKIVLKDRFLQSVIIIWLISFWLLHSL